jgi:ATP-dependent DNA ligase
MLSICSRTEVKIFEYLLVGYYENKNLMFIAKIKNGFTPALRRQVGEHFVGLETRLCPFTNLPEHQNARSGEAVTGEVMQKMRWLKPWQVAQIEFTEWTTGLTKWAVAFYFLGSIARIPLGAPLVKSRRINNLAV